MEKYDNIGKGNQVLSIILSPQFFLYQDVHIRIECEKGFYYQKKMLTIYLGLNINF